MVVSQGEKQIWGRKEVGVVIEGHMKDPNGVGTVQYLHRGDGHTRTRTHTHTHTRVPVTFRKSEQDRGIISLDSWNSGPLFPLLPPFVTSARPHRGPELS